MVTDFDNHNPLKNVLSCAMKWRLNPSTCWSRFFFIFYWINIIINTILHCLLRSKSSHHIVVLAKKKSKLWSCVYNINLPPLFVDKFQSKNRDYGSFNSGYKQISHVTSLTGQRIGRSVLCLVFAHNNQMIISKDNKNVCGCYWIWLFFLIYLSKLDYLHKSKVNHQYIESKWVDFGLTQTFWMLRINEANWLTSYK